VEEDTPLNRNGYRLFTCDKGFVLVSENPTINNQLVNNKHWVLYRTLPPYSIFVSADYEKRVMSEGFPLYVIKFLGQLHL